MLLFVQSFGIPVQSMSKLLQCLDSAVDEDAHGMEGSVVDKVCYPSHKEQLTALLECSFGSLVPQNCWLFVTSLLQNVSISLPHKIE